MFENAVTCSTGRRWTWDTREETLTLKHRRCVTVGNLATRVQKLFIISAIQGRQPTASLQQDSVSVILFHRPDLVQ
jgi:hypothetical protein